MRCQYAVCRVSDPQMDGNITAAPPLSHTPTLRWLLSLANITRWHTYVVTPRGNLCGHTKWHTYVVTPNGMLMWSHLVHTHVVIPSGILMYVLTPSGILMYVVTPSGILMWSRPVAYLCSQ